MKLQSIFAWSILLQFSMGFDLFLLFVKINFSRGKAQEQDEMPINPQKNDTVELYVDAWDMPEFWSILLAAEKQLCPMNDDK